MDQLSQHLGFLPEWAVGPIIALITIIVGYFIAKIAAVFVSSAINRTGIGKQAQTTGGNIGKSLSKAVFWVVWLVFILVGLSQFEQVADALAPVQNMIDEIFKFLPDFVLGGFVLAIGVMLAKVVKEALTSTLEAVQVDRLAAKFGFAGADDAARSNNIARSLGGLASAVVLIFFAITAIGIWKIPGISEPVSEMLETVLTYIPNIFGAAIILAVFVFIGRFVSKLATNTLPALGLDDSLKSIGSLDGDTSTRVAPSRIVATLAFAGIVLMGLTAAMRALGIPELTEIFNDVLEIGASVAFGAFIIVIGIFLANFISKIVTDASGETAGKIIKYATLLIVTFMGLNTMNLGEEIVNTAFTATLVAAAVAGGVGGAIAFGLGGRDWAGKKLEEWMPTKSKRTPSSRK